MIRRDQFVLLAKSRAWQSISHEMIEVIVINGSESNWTDADGVWSEHCGVGPSGAVLVRPDGIVAYRFQDDKLASQRAAELRIRELVNRLLKL
ncbi:hypothetical protein K469DRAFT_704344 [Zopfia rhizophila CBS 207.26]|uniref:Uncharacterized protein n=1 Tax=Zopfia rhizophila CBS 207.26 TaxID=1314779 RepID=A0A6A6EA76_9PEZI|nr:hypothetical protein K469DRAFT_704344 [Zopfia rhizophila CBS 207.26]